MPLSKQEIKSQQIDSASYVSPHYGDGGWHGSSFGSEKFDLNWEPRNHYILIRLIPERLRYENIILPENAAPTTQYRHAIVLRTGPGKWIEGVNGGRVRRPMDVKSGDEVIIGRWDDWQGFNGQAALCQEDDVRVIVKWKEKHG